MRNGAPRARGAFFVFRARSFCRGISFVAMGAAQAVEIEYWQYVFDSRVQAMDQLIEKFEAANPDITVKQTTFPLSLIHI